METVFVEVSSSKNKKKTIVGCIYRTPGTNLQLFNDQLENFLTDLCKKNIFLVGDYNIDLLKYEHNCGKKLLLDMMYSHGLYPLINKPTRITLFTATIIDNVFTNNITHETVNGIITTDISDHLRVFIMCNGIFEKHTTTCKSKFKKVRQISDTRIADLNLNLSDQNWDCIMSSNDVHASYKTFVNLFY